MVLCHGWLPRECVSWCVDDKIYVSHRGSSCSRFMFMCRCRMVHVCMFGQISNSLAFCAHIVYCGKLALIDALRRDITSAE